MIRRIVSLSLAHRDVVLVLALLLLVYTAWVASRARLDVFPEFAPPQVEVQVEAPGMSPEQVELLVTTPIETSLAGLVGLDSLRSESIQGLSIISAVFSESTDVVFARRLLAEKLAETSRSLPAGVHAPQLTPLVSATMDLLKIGLVSDRMTPMDLRSFADWTLRPRLLAVAGVAKCNVFGGEVRQLQIHVLPERLLALGIGLSDVLDAARRATGVIGAGYLDTPNQRVVIETHGQATSPSQLAQVVVTMREGAPVLLADVARVLEAGAPKLGDTLIQGRPGVLLTLGSQYGTNTLEVTERVESALAELGPLFDDMGIQVLARLHRPANFIETALANLGGSLALGGVLVALVLFAFLGSVRTTLISLLAIPLSLGAAVVALDAWGATLNVMTLGGLAVALGEVVDDAIIDVENIVRRLRARPRGQAIAELSSLVLAASLEIRGAVVFATLVVVLAFIPVLTLGGVQGKFFAPLASSYILAVLASLAVAVTVTPALALVFFGRRAPSAEPRLQTRLRAGYVKLLARVARRPRRLLAPLLLVFGAALALLPLLGGEFLPAFREGHFVLGVSTRPGTSLAEMLRIGERLSTRLLAIPGVMTVEEQIGRAELGEDAWGPHRGEFHVELARLSASEEQEVEERIREVLEQTPGIESEVLTFLGDRIGETITGETASVVINVVGQDLDLIDAAADSVARVLQGVPGAHDVQAHAPPGAPRVQVRLRPDALRVLGIRPVDALEAVGVAYQGMVVAQSFDGNRVVDLVVLLDEQRREEPSQIGELLLRNVEGAFIPLREVADVSYGSGRYEITHDGGRRRRTVTCNPVGVDLAGFVAQARAAIAAQAVLPAGVYLEFGGAAQARDAARKELLLRSGSALVGILLLLFIAFRSWPNVVLVLLNLPFALVGGVYSVALAGVLGQGVDTAIGLGSMVGFVTLFGITTRNSIMMLSRFAHLVRDERRPWTLETAIEGASDRLIPILMTALVTALGLLPLALGSGEAGREIEGPMAIVIVGGLLSSTALNLLVLPLAALRLGRFVAADDV